MSFDSDPIVDKESYPCECGGDITRDDEGWFECSDCDLKFFEARVDASGNNQYDDGQ